jgi:hypothetical protein
MLLRATVMRGWGRLVVALAIGTGCSGEDGLGLDEDEVFEEGKDDRLLAEHGVATFDSPETARLGGAAPRHTWTFTLRGDAEIVLATEEPSYRAPPVDTILYLYRFDEGTGRWGRYLARNDDESSRRVLSRIVRDLAPGRYRALVKGKTADTAGEFAFVARCEGGGCPLTHEGVSDCVGQARACAFDGLDGAIDAAEARRRLDACLEELADEDSGEPCRSACESARAEPLCVSTAGRLAFYSGRSASCRQLFSECVDDCKASDADIDIYSQVADTEEARCTETGLSSHCDDYARGHAACGGARAGETEDDCRARCLATDGAWADGEDVDAMCAESCAGG